MASRPEWNDCYGGNGISYSPPDYKYTLIFMHGLGDTARGWNDFALTLRRRQGVFLKTRFILPTAEVRPITLNGGMPMPGWSDIYDLEPDSQEDEEGFWKSAQRIEKFIDSEIAKGIDPQHIVVGGFSQGGAVGYLTGLTYAKPLGGIVGLSCWVPLVAKGSHKVGSAPSKPIQVSAESKSVPILHCHGTMDPVVKTEWGLEAVRWLKEEKNMNVTLKTYPMGHSATEEELEAVGDFIQNIFETSKTATTTPGDDQ